MVLVKQCLCGSLAIPLKLCNTFYAQDWSGWTPGNDTVRFPAMASEMTCARWTVAGSDMAVMLPVVDHNRDDA